jgi:MFS family permease
VLGAAFGSILSLGLIDRLGRLRCWQLFVLTWAIGILMQIFSSGIYGFILFARIFGGLGAGGLTVVAPLYLSEIGRAKSRGMVVSIYMVFLLSFLTIGMLCFPRFDRLPANVARLLHQLCGQRRHGSDKSTIPSGPGHTPYPRRRRVHRVIVSFRHTSLAL